MTAVSQLVQQNIEAACHDCGATGEYKASASRGGERRYFCHNDTKSCYEQRYGDYWRD